MGILIYQTEIEYQNIEYDVQETVAESGNGSYQISGIVTCTQIVEFVNVSFNILTAVVSGSGTIISRNHNDIINDYMIKSTTLNWTAATTPPGTNDNVELVEGTWILNFAQADNKQAKSLVIDSGATIKLEDNVDYYVGAFTIYGTYDKTASYQGIIHVGDSPFVYPDQLDFLNRIDYNLDARNKLDVRA